MLRSEGNMSLKNPVTLPGIDPGTLRLVGQRLNHYATPGAISKIVQKENVIWPNIQCIRRVSVQLKHHTVQYCTQVITTMKFELCLN